MAGRSNYRVKVDLSKYHQDARSFSWIYVNSTNVWFISHLKRHIKDVFGIEEPFHLLLNGNEYLPPAEDVRVLNENEIIVVEPGSGISSQRESTDGTASAMSLPLSDMENGYMKSVSTTDETSNFQRKARKDSLDVTNNQDQTSNGSTTNGHKANATMYHSIMDVTEIESSSDSKQKDDSMNSNLSTVSSYGVSAQKRKRVRRKKLSKQAETSLHEIISHHKEQTNLNKPKILNSFTLPNAMHIRFDSLDDDNANAVENGAKNATNDSDEISLNASSSPLCKNLRADHLSSLLALKNCSSPLTFPNKRPKYSADANGAEARTKIDNTIKSSKASNEPATLNNSTTVDGANNADEGNEYADVKPEDYPRLESRPEINNIVAFKVLKMGSGYTPEVSDYIVAKALNESPEKISFRILKGQAEIEGPSGKFSLPENQDEVEKIDTVEFNFAQLIEPRLLRKE